MYLRVRAIDLVVVAESTWAFKMVECVEGCSSDGGGSRRCDDDDAARGSLKGGTKETCTMIRDEKSESESA